MYNRNVLILASLIGFLSCSTPIENTIDSTIHIQPFTGMPSAQVEFVKDELLKVHPHVKVNRPIPLPSMAYYKNRNRYRADSLIKYLKSNSTEGQVVIGLTHQDISHTNGAISDFGIMGLGYQPGPACVTSTFRLSKSNTNEQLLKLCLHELGHTQGLPHCKSESCFMKDAEGKNHFDELNSFCHACKRHLRTKGWKFD